MKVPVRVIDITCPGKNTMLPIASQKDDLGAPVVGVVPETNREILWKIGIPPHEHEKEPLHLAYGLHLGVVSPVTIYEPKASRRCIADFLGAGNQLVNLGIAEESHSTA